MSKTVVEFGGAGIAGLLGVAFVVLKLTGVISWSWLWVLLPFWGGAAVVLVIVMITFIGLIVYGVCTEAARARRCRRAIGIKEDAR